MIVTYQPDEIPWEDIEELVDKALDRGSIYTAEDIRHGLEASAFQLWAWKDSQIKAILVTMIYGACCYLLLAAGTDMKNWLSNLDLVKNWACLEGCTEMRIHGRKGWERLLGFEVIGKDDLGLPIMRQRLG